MSQTIKLFPELTNATWADVNLDTLARRDFTEGKNPLIDPHACDIWVNKMAKEHGVDYTYGGYLEDRSWLWREHYLPPGLQAHLGVDYNVKAGTKVALLADATVVHIGREGTFGGWGGVLVFKLDKAPYAGADYLYYGHLAWEEIVTLGQHVKTGTVVGHIGEPHENGCWFPHLHVQFVAERVMQAAKAGPLSVDGYIPPPVNTDDFPNPHLYACGGV